MTEVLDAEILSDETTFEPTLDAHLFGWCNDALTIANSPEEAKRLHMRCPAVIDAQTWPDPARSRSTYTIKARRCSCVCHSRPVL